MTIRLHLRDLSIDYYAELGIPVPAERGGKFVVLQNLAEEHLVLALEFEQCPFHAIVVSRFCEIPEIGVAGRMVRDRFVIDTPDWRVAGGGAWFRDDAAKTFALSGRSMVYGSVEDRCLNRFREWLGTMPEFDGYSVE